MNSSILYEEQALNSTDSEEKQRLWWWSIHNPGLDTVFTPFAATGATMSSIIVFGSVFVLFLFYRERKSMKTTHKYTISMAICDLGFGLFMIPLQIYALSKKMPLALCDCSLILWTMMGFWLTSLMVLVASSIDRYWAIAFPVHYRLKAKSGIANFIIIASWVVPWVLATVYYATSDPTKQADRFCLFSLTNYNPTLYRINMTALVPTSLIIISILYVLIYRQILGVLEKSKSIKSSELKSDKMGLQIRAMQKSKLLLIIVPLAVISFLPCTVYATYLLISRKTPDVDAGIACYVLLSLNSVFNPFIYAYNIPYIRRAARNFIKHVQSIEDEANSSIQTRNKSHYES